MATSVKAKRTFKQKCLEDKTGKVVIGQPPNIPQIIGLLALILSVPLSGTAGHFSALIAYLGWLVWAILEVFQGVNYVRRVMGAIVMVILLVVSFRIF